MKLLKYVVTHDTGFAPNPFHDVCTLAACTPNHNNADLYSGDWILGHSPVATNNKIIYLMKVDEILDMNDYFKRTEFQKKKPNLKSKNRKDVVGDNIYYQDEKNNWRQIETKFHNKEKEPKQFKQDIRYHKVFIGREFYYFGKYGFELRKEGFKNFIWKGPNFKYERDKVEIKRLVNHVKRNNKTGIISKFG